MRKLIFVASLVLTLAAGCNVWPQIQSKDDNYYKVTKVVDGDTISIQIGDSVEKIRIVGINTPETVDPRKSVECFGKEASAKAREVLLNQEVSLESDFTQNDKDRYGRLLRYVYLRDGSDFGKLMISQGYAYEYTYDQSYLKQLEYKLAEQEAKNGKKGLWAENACATT
jgi:micrococcal nuclease